MKTPANEDRTCPCCKGRKGRWQHFGMVEISDHAVVDAECDCNPEFLPCRCCDGSGELVGLARATLLARGDIAPVQRRGFA